MLVINVTLVLDACSVLVDIGVIVDSDVGDNSLVRDVGMEVLVVCEIPIVLNSYCVVEAPSVG